MGVEIGGIIEEMHEDEEGRRIIDKVNVTHFSFVPDADNDILAIRGATGLKLLRIDEAMDTGVFIEAGEAMNELNLAEDEVRDALEFLSSDPSLAERVLQANATMLPQLEGAKNTDVEIWRRIPDDYYSPSIHVTEQNDIGINVGGHVLAAPVERWFAAGKATFGVEDDYIVRMPPLREYTVRARIKKEKGTPRFVGLEDEVMDAMKICVSDETLVELGRLIDESMPPVTFLDKIRYWTFNDWKDWLMDLTR